MGGSVEIGAERRRAAWEAVVREDPARAKRFGPPNWLVQEKKRPGESHLECATRLGDEIIVPKEALEHVPTGPDYERLLAVQNGNVPKNPVGTADVPRNVPICPECSKRPLPVSRAMCNACRMRLQRRGR